MGSDDWESFNFETWGVDDTTDGAAGNRERAIEEMSRSGEAARIRAFGRELDIAWWHTTLGRARR